MLNNFLELCWKSLLQNKLYKQPTFIFYKILKQEAQKFIIYKYNSIINDNRKAVKLNKQKEAFKKEAWLLSTGLHISTHIFEVTTKILRE